jgi:hypothetical protein
MLAETCCSEYRILKTIKDFVLIGGQFQRSSFHKYAVKTAASKGAAVTSVSDFLNMEVSDTHLKLIKRRVELINQKW